MRKNKGIAKIIEATKKNNDRKKALKNQLDFDKAFWGNVKKLKGQSSCWLWNGKSKSDYPSFKGIKCHRYSYKTHKGDIPIGMFVCHKCDNPRCVKPSHLFLGTCADNVMDAVRKGRLHYVKGNESLTELHAK